MSDDLHKYPGNLKQQKVDPMMPYDPYLTELRKALEPMEREMDTAKQFLLLAGERDALLAARAKDAELIQRLVDGIQQIADEGHWTPEMHELLNAAAAAGFKPSEP